MKNTATLSSKGQIVIPKNIRIEAGLNAGDRFRLVWMGDHLELHKIDGENVEPSPSIVKELLGKYNAADEDSSTKDTIRNLRETLYGKIDN